METSVKLSGNDFRYRCGEFQSWPFGSDRRLIHADDPGKCQIVPKLLADLLGNCSNFATLEQHAQACAANGIDLNLTSESLMTMLRQLADGRWLLREEEFIDRLVGQADGAKGQLTTLAVMTSARGTSFCRSLCSYIENTANHGRQMRFLVMDDSRSSDDEMNHRALLREITKRYCVPIFFGGITDRKRFAAMLSSRGISPGVLEFALFGMPLGLTTYGASRNALLLETVGDMVLSVDDDTVCEISEPPDCKTGLAASSSTFPCEVWSPIDLTNPIAEPLNADFAGLHEQWLGARTGTCAVANDGAPVIRWESAGPSLLRRLLHQDARVKLTVNGSLGDCGWGSPLPYLLLNQESLHRLLSSERSYKEACGCRQILQSAVQPTLSESERVVMMFAGFDHREMLPPFMPIGRGQDTIYITTLLSTCDSACILHLPFALLHAPAEKRHFWPGEVLRSASGIDLASLLRTLLRSCREGFANSPSRKLGQLGKHLSEIACLPEAEFWRFTTEQLWAQLAVFVAELEQKCSLYSEAPFLLKDIGAFLDCLRKAAVRPAFAIPLDVLYGRSVEDARKLTQNLIGQFGALLSSWNDLVAETRLLRAGGHSLAVPV